MEGAIEMKKLLATIVSVLVLSSMPIYASTDTTDNDPVSAAAVQQENEIDPMNAAAIYYKFTKAYSNINGGLVETQSVTAKYPQKLSTGKADGNYYVHYY